MQRNWTVWITILGITAYNIRYISSECTDDKASFLMTSNAELDTENEYSTNNVDLTGCVNLCREDIECKSLTFKQIGQSNENAKQTVCILSRDDGVKNPPKFLRNASANDASYFLRKLCIKNSCQKLFNFEMLKGMVLDGFNNRVIENISQKKCLESCVTEQNFTCRSAEWDELTKECHLSRYDRFNRNSMFKTTKASAYYFDNACAYRQGESGNTAEILLLGNVDHPFSLVEYTGESLTVSDCGQKCLDTTNFMCRSFLYGQRPEDGSNYCGLSHQNRLGLLRTPSSFKPTPSINYFEIARNLASCDSSDISLELISGIYLEVTPYKVTNNLSPGECAYLCKTEEKCKALNIDYDAGLCKFLAERSQANLDTRFKISKNYNYFEKSCVFGSDQCAGQWTFERVRSKTLVGVHQPKLVVRSNTKEECQSACLSTRDFVCRSAEYNYDLKECRLSSHNRFSTSDRHVQLEDAKLVVDYFESNCYKEARGFCNVKKTRQRAQILADETVQTSNADECKAKCFSISDFICRSFAYDATSRICQLSHHTLTSLPNTFRRVSTFDYYDVYTCFQVSVSCKPEQMIATVETNKMFQGRIYARSAPTTCYSDVSDSTAFSLPLNLNGPECATISQAEGKFSNVIVIQANDKVVTSVDKAIGLHCTYEVGNSTKNATLSFNITELNSSDSARGAAEIPNLFMRIVDAKGDETEAVSLGDLLKVQVLMDDESTYGIFLRNMVARSAVDNSEITLIDDLGCPIEVKMMKEVRRVDGTGRKALESYLEAFTFTGSNLLTIETEVETCINNCKPVTCQIPSGRSEDIHSVLSYGRKKRNALKNGRVVSTVTLSRTVAVKSSELVVDNSAYKESPVKPVHEPRPRQFSVEEDKTMICVEPTIAAIIGSLILFIQGITFAICIGCMCKRFFKNRIDNAQGKNKSIYYNNCKY